jgi:transposase
VRCRRGGRDCQGSVKVSTDPHVLVTFFKRLGFAVTPIGLEAGPLSQWLYTGLSQAGFEVVLLEARHTNAALSAMEVKTLTNSLSDRIM